MKKLCAGMLCVLLLGFYACAQTAPEETVQETTGYFEMVWEWQCPEGKYASYINTIYHTEEGTAGSSGKAAISAVKLLEFSKAFSEDGSDELDAVFASMNDAQARFFAAQWIWLYSLACWALEDPEQFHESYDWVGLEDFEASLYSSDDLYHLNDEIGMFLFREEMM